MINFEEKISKSVRVKTKNLDTSAFILNLKNRQNKELKRMKITDFIKPFLLKTYTQENGHYSHPRS